MADAIQQLRDNLGEVNRLLEIHEEVTGDARGRRFGVEVLNKSGVVLAVACWEAYVEDCATEAFDFILGNAGDPTKVPEAVRKLVAKAIKADPNDLSPWWLAGEGWKARLKTHYDATIKKYVSPLNTPRHTNVDSLFNDLVGLSDVSAAWTWHRMPAATARTRLSNIITLRGEIAHRVSSPTVHKQDVEAAVSFIQTIANLTSNRVRNHINGLLGVYVWPAQPTPGRPGRPRR